VPTPASTPAASTAPTALTDEGAASSSPDSASSTADSSGQGCDDAGGTYIDDDGGNGGASFDVAQSACTAMFTYDGAEHVGIVTGSVLQVEGWSRATFNTSGVRFDDGGSWQKVLPDAIFQPAPISATLAPSYAPTTATTPLPTLVPTPASTPAASTAPTALTDEVAASSTPDSASSTADSAALAPTYAPTTSPTPLPTLASCSYSLCGNEQSVSDLTSNSLCSKDGSTVTAPLESTCDIDCTDVEGAGHSSGTARLTCEYIAGTAFFTTASMVASLGTCVCSERS